MPAGCKTVQTPSLKPRRRQSWPNLRPPGRCWYAAAPQPTQQHGTACGRQGSAGGLQPGWKVVRQGRLGSDGGLRQAVSCSGGLRQAASCSGGLRRTASYSGGLRQAVSLSGGLRQAVS
eukprot:39070-Chlamydomonas_euryale.AAC.1